MSSRAHVTHHTGSHSPPPLYHKPPREMDAGAAASAPMWRTGAFAGEFGDAFISDTELEGGQVAPSIEILVGVIRHVLKTRREELTSFRAGDPDKIEHICTDLLEAAARDQAVGGVGPASRSGSLNNDAFAVVLEKFVKRLAGLGPGQRVVVSGGWAKKFARVVFCRQR